MKKMVGIFLLLSISQASFAGQSWSQPEGVVQLQDEQMCPFCKKEVTEYSNFCDEKCGAIICNNCRLVRENQEDILYSKKNKKHFVVSICVKCNKENRIYARNCRAGVDNPINWRARHGTFPSVDN